MTTLAFEPPTQRPVADLLRAHLMGCGVATCVERVSVPGGLVDVREVAPSLRILPAPPWSHPELRFRVHPEVASRLEVATTRLPDGMRIGFWEGLRPVVVQRRLWERSLLFLRDARPDLDAYSLELELERYVARPEPATGPPPPHSTGSAVDVAAVDAFGRVLDPHHLWGQLGVEEMARALRETGLASYAAEWWHWSFGDEEWARANDCDPLPFALTSPEHEFDGPGGGI